MADENYNDADDNEEEEKRDILLASSSNVHSWAGSQRCASFRGPLTSSSQEPFDTDEKTTGGRV